MGRKKLTTEQWIEACRAKRLDFDDYDFSMVEYVGNKTKVLIIHKSFPDYIWYVSPNGFKDNGYSHPMITNNYRYTTEQWVEECKKVRDDFEDYDFSKVEYVGSRKKVQLIHKDYPEYPWFVTPFSFKDKGYSHPMITNNYRYTTEQWVEECKKVREDFDQYDFSKVEYVGNKTKVDIRHKDYPEYPWFVAPYAFKDMGVSHPLLHNRGYSRTDFKNFCIKNNQGKGFLYLIYFVCQQTKEEFCKIGITSRSIKERFSSNSYSHLKIKKTVLLEQDPNLIYDLENEILREYKKYKFTPEIPFDGQTECFTSTAWPIILKEKLSQYLIT